MSASNNWKASLLIYKDIRVIRLLILGFSSGLPILLIFSTLSLWLKSAGVDRSTITLFSWAGLAYSFKFLWAPVIDKMPIIILNDRFGHRKSWLMFSQSMLIMLFLGLGFVDPKYNLLLMAVIIVCVGFCSATQDAMVDTYRIESAPAELQSAMSGIYIVGYRLGMIAAGAGSLFLASFFGGDEQSYNVSAWQKTYMIMAVIQSIGLICTIISPEPPSKRILLDNFKDRLKLINVFFVSTLLFILIYNFFPIIKFHDPFIKGFFIVLKLLIALSGMIIVFTFAAKLNYVKNYVILSTFLDPITSFVKKYGSMAIVILVIIGLYRIADIVMGVVANLFYSDMGYTLNQIASISKFWGLIATIFGGLLGGILASKYNNYSILLLGAILAASTNILFAILATLEPIIVYLMIVIIADNIAAGIASVAFVAFLSSLTNINFTTSQFALFTSLMLFLPKIIGGYSGSIVDSFGYFNFFFITAVMGLPVVILIIAFKNKLYNN
ncbi:MFS transporter [Alphaproteobacteria bacterium]|nr:MFS transporter [Alphaproteobacteria bacterium]MDC1085902.1 MFS transporter [Alphaproteobacteria bacterium]